MNSCLKLKSDFILLKTSLEDTQASSFVMPTYFLEFVLGIRAHKLTFLVHFWKSGHFLKMWLSGGLSLPILGQ